MIKDNYYEKYGLVVDADEVDNVLTIKLSDLESPDILYMKRFILNGHYRTQTDDLIDDCVYMYEKSLEINKK